VLLPHATPEQVWQYAGEQLVQAATPTSHSLAHRRLFEREPANVYREAVADALEAARIVTAAAVVGAGAPPPPAASGALVEAAWQEAVAHAKRETSGPLTAAAFLSLLRALLARCVLLDTASIAPESVHAVACLHPLLQQVVHMYHYSRVTTPTMYSL
jgi:hypothetical protein